MSRVCPRLRLCAPTTGPAALTSFPPPAFRSLAPPQLLDLAFGPMGARGVIAFLPRNCDLRQIAETLPEGHAFCEVHWGGRGGWGGDCWWLLLVHVHLLLRCKSGTPTEKWALQLGCLLLLCHARPRVCCRLPLANRLSCQPAGCKLPALPQVEREMVNNHCKGLTIYYGALARNSQQLRGQGQQQGQQDMEGQQQGQQGVEGQLPLPPAAAVAAGQAAQQAGPEPAQQEQPLQVAAAEQAEQQSGQGELQQLETPPPPPGADVEPARGAGGKEDPAAAATPQRKGRCCHQ